MFFLKTLSKNIPRVIPKKQSSKGALLAPINLFAPNFLKKNNNNEHFHHHLLVPMF